MGTRNLTVVVKNEQVRVAQYGQWDGYPEVSGVGCLRILRENVDNLINGLSNCIEVDEDLHAKMLAHAEEKAGNDRTPEDLAAAGFMSMSVSDVFEELYPEQHRNTGFRILKMIADSKTPLYLSLNFEFASETLWCEWAYVVDLDNGKFETYSNRGEGGQGIFARLGEDTVSMVASYDLDELPSDEEYMRQFMQEE